MTEAEIKSCIAKSKTMKKILASTEESANKIVETLRQNSKAYHTLGNTYLDLGKNTLSSILNNTTPNTNFTALTQALKIIVSIVELTGQSYTEQAKNYIERVSEEYDKALMELKHCKKKMHNVVQTLHRQATAQYKDYAKAYINYESVKKNISDITSQQEKNSNDPVLKYVVSAQENNIEKLKQAKKKEELATNQLIQKHSELNSRLNFCNVEISDCETIFRRAMAQMLYIIQSIVVEKFANFNTQVMEIIKKEQGDFSSFVSRTSFNTNELQFKEKAIEKNKILSAEWLWNEQFEIKVENAPEIYFKFLLEATLQFGKDQNDYVKLVTTLFDGIKNAEEQVQKTLEQESLNFRKYANFFLNTTEQSLSTSFKDWGDIIVQYYEIQAGSHAKMLQYIGSNVVLKCKSIQNKLEADGQVCKNEGQKKVIDVSNGTEEVEKASNQLQKIISMINEKKEEMGKIKNEKKKLENCVNMLVTLGDQKYQNEGFLEKSKKQLYETIKKNVKEITQIRVSYLKSNMDLQEQICITISGFLSYLLTFWEQKGQIKEMLWKKANSVAYEDDFKKMLNSLDILDTENTESNIEEISEGPMDITKRRNKKKVYIQTFPLIKLQRESNLELHSVMESLKSEHASGESWISTKFGLNESVQESFLCALSWKILLQGRLYITNTKLCFHSLFNNSTIFGGQTKIVIPLNEIARLEKMHNALIFDNSIAIHTKETEFFFTSFVFRDRAFELIEKNMQNLNDKDQSKEHSIVIKPVSVIYSSSEKNQIAEEYKIFLDEISEIEKDRLKQVVENEGFKIDTNQQNVILDKTYDCPIQILFSSIHVKSHKISRKCEELSANTNVVLIKELQHPSIYTSYKDALGVHIKASFEEKEKLKSSYKKMPLKGIAKQTCTHGLRSAIANTFSSRQMHN